MRGEAGMCSRKENGTGTGMGMNPEKTRYKVPCIFGRREPRPIVTEVPGSKSITNRALLLATLAEGRSRLFGALFSDDSRHFLQCIQELGFETSVDEEKKTIEVTGLGGVVPKSEASLYVGSAGTAARFLSAYLGVSQGRYHLDASGQMRRRPMKPLLACLEELGCRIECEGEAGCFPFTLWGNGFGKSRICVDIGDSSQFLSALLIASGLSEHDMEIQIQGSHGMAYIRMTERMMEQFGVVARHPEEGCYRIAKGQQYRAMDYRIEPDASAACYFYAMAPLLGTAVQVRHVHFGSLQGDVEFLRILERMGCRVWEDTEGVWVSGPKEGRYEGVEADLSACSDQAITLAALAPFGKGPTVIKGIGHIRKQESDRMEAIVTELQRMGISCEMGADFIKIYPGHPKPCLVETNEDHRMAMGFSLIGLRAKGIAIEDPLCCRKTFEEYFDKLDAVIEEQEKM